jgi:hypothetical protein
MTSSGVEPVTSRFVASLKQLHYHEPPTSKHVVYLITTAVYIANKMVILQASKWYLKAGTVICTGDSLKLDEDKLEEHPGAIATASRG